MTDLDIIYQIYEDYIYLEPIVLEKIVSQIKNETLSTGLLVDLLGKHKVYGTNPKSIANILFEKYNNLDPEESHVTFIDTLCEDPRGPLTDFIYECDGDLAENPDFISWIHSLTQKDLEIVEAYCIRNEYYEVISFILKTKNSQI